MNVLFIGPSGSGKDTQADLLVKNKNYLRVSTGDLIRLISEGQNDIHNVIRVAMNKGFLSDSFVFGLLQMYIEHLEHPKVVLSGAVRRYSQIDLLDFVLFKSKRRLDIVVYFDLSDELAIERMSSRVRCSACLKNFSIKKFSENSRYKCEHCGGELTRRADDHPDAIPERLKAYHKDISEILEEYGKRGLLRKIDASKNIQEIYSEVEKLID